MDPDGALVLNLEDPVVGGYAGLGTAPGRPVPATTAPCPAGSASWTAGSWRRPWSACRSPAGGVAQAGPGGGIMPVDELGIPGRHNVSNALAAIAVGLLFGVAPDAIRRAAAAFTGVEHRLQSVGLVDGVRFVNDSQGTQPDAVIAALRAFPAPVVLIAGGRDKGVDLVRPRPGRRARRAAAAVLIGESGPTLEGLFRDAGLARTARAATMDEAVAVADALAHLALGDAPAGTVGHRGPEPGRRHRSTCSRTTRPAAAPSSRPWAGSLPRAPPASPVTGGPHEHRAAHGRPHPGQGPDAGEHPQARAPRARVRDPRRDRRPGRDRAS